MTINVIVPTILIASTSYIQPIFEVNYVKPVVAVSYIEPVFRANYLQIKVAAEVTMPDVLTVDIITPVDLVTLSTEKALADQTNGFADILAKTTAKGFLDSTTELDAIKLVFEKKLADVQSLADAKNINIGKALADVAYPSDLAKLTTVKALADNLAVSPDTVAKAVNKAFADSNTLSDAIATVLIYIRSFADSTVSSDAQAKTTTLNKIDAVYTADANQLTLAKATADGINAIDNMDGDLTYAFVKVIGDMLLNSDTQIIDFKPQKADNITTSSSGILAMQDYCDITYFLEDYVGISRTFT